MRTGNETPSSNFVLPSARRKPPLKEIAAGGFLFITGRLQAKQLLALVALLIEPGAQIVDRLKPLFGQAFSHRKTRA